MPYDLMGNYIEGDEPDYSGPAPALPTWQQVKTGVAGAARELPKAAGRIASGAASDAESLLRGAAAVVPGVLGDTERFGRKAINWLDEFVSGKSDKKAASEETILPTTDDMLKKHMPDRFTDARPESNGMEQLGALANLPGMEASGRLATSIPGALKHGATEFAKAAGNAGTKAAPMAGAAAATSGADWLNEFSTPAAPAKSADDEYDVSEYAHPADETRSGRMKRLLSQGKKDTGVEGFGKFLGGLGETALSAASGAAGGAVGGLEMAARVPFQGVRKAVEAGQKTQQAMTYEPRLNAGKLGTEVLSAPFELASEYAGKGLGAAGSLVGPKIEAALTSIGEALPGVAATVLPLKGMRDAARAPKVALPAESPKQAAAIKAQDAGYVLPPSEANPTAKNKAMTGYGGKTATQQEASVKNQEITNTKAKKELGLPEDDTLGPDAYEAFRKTQGKAYATAAGLGELDVTGSKLPAEVKTTRTGSSAMSGVRDVVDAAELVRAWKVLNADARAAYESNSRQPHPDMLARADKANAEAKHVDRLIAKVAKKNGTPELYDELRAARQNIAKSYALEKITNPATGNVDAQALGRDLKRGKFMTGGLKTIGEFAAAFPKAAQMPEKIGATPGISPLDVATGGIEGATALAAGKPGLAAGAIGTVLGRPLARAYGLSEGYQKGGAAAKKYDTFAADSARRRAVQAGGLAGSEEADKLVEELR